MQGFKKFIEIFGLFGGPKKSKLYNDPEYGAAFKALVQKHGNNENDAEFELVQLMKTPAGQYQLKRMGMQVQGEPEQQMPGQWNATATGGAQMFNQKPGSSKT